MDLRIRVGLALGAILLGTIVSAWFITAGGVVRNLIGELVSERIDIAVYVAEQLEEAEHPRLRVEELAEQLRIQVAVGPRPPLAMSQRARRVDRDGREVLVLRGPKAPLAVAMSPHGRERWLLVHFPADLDRPPRRIGMGLLGLLVGSLALGLLVLYQVFRPLHQTTAAMRRIADGELDHRLTVGSAVPEAERTFNQMADRVQSLVQGQRDLMAAVSHELRTPLSRMRLQLAMLEGSADPRRVADLERDVAEVDELVEELLESARLHQGQLALQWGTVSAANLAGEALGSIELGDHPVQLEASPSLQFSGDFRRLLRCLRNLLSNVVRYTPPETPVALRIVEDGGAIVISVTDSGPGVSEEEGARLFEPFYRTEASRSRRTGGIGLGLMLVRQIAEAHGGRAEALHPPEGGLEIRLVLPRKTGPPPSADLR
jgi:signal transduction histidine kinase